MFNIPDRLSHIKKQWNDKLTTDIQIMIKYGDLKEKN